MSVDKFGRYSEFAENIGSLRQRGGLPLTSDGDYDIGNKRLKFVNDPKDNNDGINWKTLKSEISTALKLEGEVYNADSHRITNVARPVDKNDSINREYLLHYTNKNFLKLSNEKSYNAQNKKIINIADPTADGDSINMKYLHSVIPAKTTGKFSFYNSVISDIGYPVTDNDGVNLKYITDHCITHDVGTIDCKDKVLSNVKEGSAESDAATISQTMKIHNGDWFARNRKIGGVNAGTDPRDVTTVQQVKSMFIGTDENNPNVYTCNDKRITRLKDPEDLDNAVTVNYLARLLGQMFVDFYNEIVDNTKSQLHSPIVGDAAKRDWIDKNIIRPYFINYETRSFRMAANLTTIEDMKNTDQS